MGNVAVNVDNANIYIVTAPSGAGKTSLVSRLTAEVENLKVSVSHTTRACLGDNIIRTHD